jgi:hypothetical protein
VSTASAPAPPEPGAPATPAREPAPDIFAWLGERELTWTGWGTAVALGFFSVLFGLRGVYAYWRGEAPNKEKGIPTLPFALGLLAFGAWVLWVIGMSRLPG